MAHAISPALIETDMIAGNPKARPEMIPVGRFGQTEKVCNVAVMPARNGYRTVQTTDYRTVLPEHRKIPGDPAIILFGIAIY